MTMVPLESGGGSIPFEDNWVLRWNVEDTSGTNAGKFAIVLANLAFGGSAPIGNTPLLPGFTQVWAGSTPSGVAVTVAPGIVGGAEVVLSVPANTLMPTDTVRLQAIMIDPRLAPQSQHSPRTRLSSFTVIPSASPCVATAPTRLTRTRPSASSRSTTLRRARSRRSSR